MAISPERLEQLADWIDGDYALKMAQNPGDFPCCAWHQRGHQIQDELRQWAAELRAGERG